MGFTLPIRYLESRSRMERDESGNVIDFEERFHKGHTEAGRLKNRTSDYE